MSAKSALNRYYRRQAMHKERSPRRRNGKPEWELTKKPCMAWFKENGWSMNAVEAKAVFSHAAGRYVAGQVDAGFSDAVGCAPDGTAAFVEFKAPKRRNTLKPHQHEFLKERIEKGSFAICTDSVEFLNIAWAEFCHRRKMDPHLAVAYLLRLLPIIKSELKNQELIIDE